MSSIYGQIESLDSIRKSQALFIESEEDSIMSININSNIGTGLLDTGLLERKYKAGKMFSVMGNTSLGYDYGVIPLVTNQQLVSGYYYSEGRLDFTVLSVPIGFTYYYSTLKGISGLNNHYSFTLDVDKYKSKIKKDAFIKEKELNLNIDSLLQHKQTLVKKLAFNELEIDYQSKALSKIDDIANHLMQIPKDTIQLIDGKEVPIDVEGYRNRYNEQKEKGDSLRASIEEKRRLVGDLRDKIGAVESDITQIREKVESVRNYANPSYYTSHPYLSKFKQAVHYVKKIDIGMCYPNYSTFLINGIALNGISLEMESSRYFFAVSHGVSVNTFYQSGNLVENSLNRFKQMFDFLDYSNLNNNRRLTSVKFGLGRVSESHIHFGVLYGLSNSNSMFSGIEINEGVLNQNYVVEIDGKYVFNTNNSIEFVYGKSHLQRKGEESGGEGRGFEAIFNPVRSNAAVVALKSQIPKSKTNISISLRWLDPFFKSYGIGFNRSDVMRGELKVGQKLGKRINMGMMYRKNEDNILNIYDYKNTMDVIGLNLGYRITRNISLKAIYNTIIHEAHYSGDNVFSLNSFIYTGVLNWTIPKLNTTLSMLYNQYDIKDSLSTSRFENMSLIGMTQISKTITNNLSLSSIRSNMTDTLSGDCIVITDDIMVLVRKRASIGLNAKYSIQREESQLGYGVKVSINMMKRLSMNLSFDKIVYGMFYDYYQREQIEKFPYYCSAKISYKW